MKALKITYWATTALFSLMMAFSAIAYVTQEEMKAGFAQIGFPDYFRIELAAAKLIGVVILLAPVAGRLKEWAYAGFTIVLISAFIAHAAQGDPVGRLMSPLIAIAILLTSYFTYHKKQHPTSLALS